MNNNVLIMGVLFVLVFVAGFGVGRLTAGSSGVVVNSNSGPQTAGTVGQTGSSSTGAQEGTKVNANNLTDGQRKMLTAMGIDPNSITITPTMVACAEAKLGAPRIEEIKNGATPSFSEGATLIACYR